MKQKEQRVGIFIDVQNLYYSAKHLYNAKVNFSEILNTGLANRKLIRAFAYVIKAESKEENSFFTALSKIGFEIRMKELQTFYGGAKKGDWDVGIAMDIVRMAPKLDVVVLVSGDGDFKELLDYVGSLGCRTEVLAFGKSASSKLKETAEEFVDLDKNASKYLIARKQRAPPIAAKKPAKKS